MEVAPVDYLMGDDYVPEDESTVQMANTTGQHARQEEEPEEVIYAYQVSFSEEDIGKRRAKSKKRITWQFGMANDQVHTVSLVWSMNSGKQTVEMDGTEVWFGRQKGASTFSHKWTTDDGLKLHILASWMIPQYKHKQFQNFYKSVLMINSRSFFSLPLQDGSKPTSADEYDYDTDSSPSSIVEIFYPTGYHWDDRCYADKEDGRY